MAYSRVQSRTQEVSQLWSRVRLLHYGDDSMLKETGGWRGDQRWEGAWKNNTILSTNSNDQSFESSLATIRPDPHFSTEKKQNSWDSKMASFIPFPLMCNTCLKGELSQVKEFLNWLYIKLWMIRLVTLNIIFNRCFLNFVPLLGPKLRW